MMGPKDDQAVESSADITNPRDIQGILAILVTSGLLAVIAFAMFKAGTLSDALSVVNVLAPLAALVLGYQQFSWPNSTLGKKRLNDHVACLCRC